MKAKAFPPFPVLFVSASFLLSRFGTSPKSESGVAMLPWALFDEML